MLENVPIVPHHPRCDSKQLPIRDTILFFQCSNHINEVFHGLLQVREIEANFLPHPSSYIAVPQCMARRFIAPQRPHLLSEVTFLDARQKFVGKIFLHALQRKCLILFQQLSFHTNFHKPTLLSFSEHAPPTLAWFASSSTLRATQYALLLVNFPFLDQAQIRES